MAFSSVKKLYFALFSCYLCKVALKHTKFIHIVLFTIQIDLT